LRRAPSAVRTTSRCATPSRTVLPGRGAKSAAPPSRGRRRAGSTASTFEITEAAACASAGSPNVCTTRAPSASASISSASNISGGRS